MILVISNSDDAHADHVEAILRARGAAFQRFDPAMFPVAAQIAVSYAAAGRSSCTLRLGETQIDLCRVRAVWYRRPQLADAHVAITDCVAREFVQDECRQFVQDLWSSLDCPWLPARPAVTKSGGLKATQLKVAGELGFELPPTLITNSAPHLLDFYRQHGGDIVCKMVGTAILKKVGATFARYTEAVSPRDIAHAYELAYCPMIFQARVPKQIELRITVVGRQVFAAEIHSQSSNHTRLDWRRYDEYSTTYAPHVLRAETEERCVELVGRLGLCYAAIDMIVTPDGRYVFIELNPNGQYLWIERETSLPISDAICDLLTGAPPRFRSADRKIDSSIGAMT
jgi:hypothetical protein